MPNSDKQLFEENDVEKIDDNVIVAFHYRLTNDDGEVIDESFGEEPLLYLHGNGAIVAGLEKEMLGKKRGDKFSVDVSPEEGYGLPSGQESVPVGRDSFPDEMPIEKGLPVPAELENGQMVIFHIADFDDETVYLSIDHPLAGQTLHFEIEVVDMRPSTEEEREHGHVHAHGDHDHDHEH